MKRTLAFAISAQAISIVILLLLSSQFFRQLNTLSNYTDKVERTYLILNQLAQVRSQIKDAETSARGYVIAEQPAFLNLLKSSEIGVFHAIDSLRYLLIGRDSQIVLLKRIERLSYKKVELQIEMARLKKRATPAESFDRMERGRVLMDQIEYYIDRMKANELLILKEGSKSKRLFADRLPGNVRKVFLIAALSTLVFGLWIFIEVKKRFRYQQLLQRKLMELRQNNEELEQIAFAASHDLQEPLRKIRIFSDRLLLKTKDKGDEDNYHMTQRMNQAATRLQELISDLVLLNNLMQNKYEASSVVLNEVVDLVLKTYDHELKDIHAEVSVSELPAVKASPVQVAILFEHLFKNAIQFRSTDRDLEIIIRCETLKWHEISGLPAEITDGMFYHVSMMDNGIGFDETYKSKMFKPFQRLHNYNSESDAKRKGMGLAMSKRVMLNLGGWIDAEGEVGQGAVIHLYFPSSEPGNKLL